MMLLHQGDRKRLEEFFRHRLVNPVRIVLFTREPSPVWKPWDQSCQFCKETKEIVGMLGNLSPLIQVESYDLGRDMALAQQYQVDKVPALLLMPEGKDLMGIRYYGIPAGFEFMALIEDITDISRGTTDLDASVRERIKAITSPVHIQVFVTPTCPYCPRAVRTAHKFALENPLIRADMVEATEFPGMAERYRVFAVPKVVINETVQFEGALSDDLFALHVLEAAGQLRDDEAQELMDFKGMFHHHHEQDEFEHEHHSRRHEH